MPGVLSLVELALELEDAVNAHRRRLGRRELERDPALAAAARQHSQRMRNLGFFDHTDPYDRTSSMDRIEAVDPGPWTIVAENLAAGVWDADGILQSWLRSPGHRANVEHPELTLLGTDVAHGGPLRAYTTQVYGTRGGWR
jgi:uncharacterized protein YkwD